MTIQVNVLFGGPSAEHEVSLNSAQGVIANLDRSKYRIRAVFVSKKKEFYFKDITGNSPETSDLSNTVLYRGPFTAASSGPVWEDCSIAFLALHGTFGEDGVIQGFLDSLDIPYTGSGVMASALAMDKIISKFIFIQSGLTVPPYSIFGRNHPHNSIDEIFRKHGFPCFVKCPQSGSSRLMGKADTKEQLRTLLTELQPHSSEILIESAINGVEFSCGVLEDADGTVKALPPIEIRPKSTFFDYTAKYTDGASEEIVPAPYPEELLKRIGDIAIRAHQMLGCSGFSRTDMIYNNDELYVLETNTLPGLTRNSLLPKAFKAAGGTYPGLLDIFIESALNKKVYSSVI